MFSLNALKDKRTFFHYNCSPAWLNARNTLPSTNSTKWNLERYCSLCSYMQYACCPSSKITTQSQRATITTAKSRTENGLEAVPNWISIDVPVAQRTKEGSACWMCMGTQCVQTSQNKTYQIHAYCCHITLYGIVWSVYWKKFCIAMWVFKSNQLILFTNLVHPLINILHFLDVIELTLDSKIHWCYHYALSLFSSSYNGASIYSYCVKRLSIQILWNIEY